MNRWTAGGAVLFCVVGFGAWQLARSMGLPVSTPIRLAMDRLMQPAVPSQLLAWKGRGEGDVRLIFAGDVIQHENQANEDYAATYAGLRPLVGNANLAIANLEFPVNPAAPLGPAPGSVVFNGSERHVKALSAVGFDLVSTANNHLFDQGIEGAESTLRVIREAGMQPVGSAPRGNPVEVRIMDAGGLRIAFAAYTSPPNIYPDKGKSYKLWSREWPVNELNFDDWSGEYRKKGLRLFARDAAAAKQAGAGLLVALVHWGREWQFQPSEDQRLAARDLIEAGFQLVVGSHAHVVSPPEVYQGRLIAYSLGNLVSDFAPMETRLGALLEVRLASSPDGRAEVADFVFRPVLTDRKQPNHPVRLLQAGPEGEDAEAWSLASRVLGTPSSGVQ